MKMGAFTTITEPFRRGDMYVQCLHMMKECFDAQTVIDGSRTWPKEFDWPVIGQHFQKGYEQTNADWVFHIDTDFFFHEKDIAAIRKACEDNPDAPALSFWKYQFVQPDKYNLKSRLVIAVNKRAYGDRIRFDSGGDLCQPSLDGEYINPNDVPEARIGFYNYEKLTKTKDQVKDDVGRMERAYKRHFGTTQYGSDGTDEDAYNKWLEAQLGKLSKPHKEIALTDHPIYVQKTIKQLKPDQFGYNAFGSLERNRYA